MPRQVLELSGLTGEGWRGAVLLDPALVEGGGRAYLRHIRAVGASIQVRLSASATADPNDPGPAFSADLLTYARALTFAKGGDVLVLKGPGHEDNSSADPTEPYFWTPDNGLDSNLWFIDNRGDFTLTLDDGISIFEIAGRAEAVAQVRARVDRVPPHRIAGTAAAGAPQARARLDVLPALTLADFDTAGLAVETLALIRAGAGPADTIYAAPPRGSVGALVDGELGLGPDEAAITRLRRRDGNMLGVNDDDPLVLSDYFGTGGAGAGLTLYVQTQDGVATLPVSEQRSSGGGFVVFGPLGAALDRIVDGIGEGDLFIFALARTAHEVRGRAEAGGAEARAGVRRAVRHIVGGRAEAGAPEARARVDRVPPDEIAGRAEAGTAEARARVARVTPTVRAIAGRAGAGGAAASARVAVRGPLTLADFDTAGLEIDMLALIEAGAGSGGVFYDAATNAGAVGTLLDGELGVGGNEAPIIRMTRRSGDQSLVLQFEVGTLATDRYFGAGGEGHDLRVFVQTLSEVFSRRVTRNEGIGSASIQLGRYGRSFAALMRSIGDGDRFIVALARFVRHTLAGTAAAGAPQARARLDVLPALTLADFDTRGLDIEALALIRAGPGPADTIYAAPPRGTVGALVDGELGLGPGEVPITRLRRRNGAMLAVNDDDPLALADYFGTGGAGAGLTLYVQTQDGLGTISVAVHGTAGDDFIQFGPIGAALDAILDGIGEGDLFIFALARAVHEVRGRAGAGPAEARARVRRAVGHIVGGRAEAGAPEARARVQPVREHLLRGRAGAGPPEARARLRRVPVVTVGGTAAAGAAQARATLRAIRLLRGRAGAGAAQARVRLRLAVHRHLRGRAEAGGAQARAQVRRVPTASEQYGRTLRQSAPERGLLIALEIRHPAVAEPVRVINDTVERVIEGELFVPLRFDARLADDVDGQAPQAELAIDNVGRALTQWVEAAGGGTGAAVRFMQIIDIDDPPVEWELTMDVAGMEIDSERITARLGFDPLLGRAAVTLRHDPQTSPGLF